MNDIKVLTKLYELMELIGREEVYKLLERALTDTEKDVANDDIWHDTQDQARRDYKEPDEPISSN